MTPEMKLSAIWDAVYSDNTPEDKLDKIEEILLENKDGESHSQTAELG